MSSQELQFKSKHYVNIIIQIKLFEFVSFNTYASLASKFVQATDHYLTVSEGLLKTYR